MGGGETESGEFTEEVRVRTFSFAEKDDVEVRLLPETGTASVRVSGFDYLQISLICVKRLECVSFHCDSLLYLNLAITNNNLKVMLRSKLPRVDFSHPDFGKLGPSKLYSFDHVSVDCDYLVEIDYPSKSPSMELVLVGSCNGVVCIVPNFFAAYLFNPSTREYKRIPHGHLGDIEIPNNFTIEDFPIAYGFGYDQVVEDYKVVRMVSLINRNNYEKNLSEVRVYSLGSNLWRWIGNVTYKVVNGVSGVFVNGALYWVVRDYTREEGSTTVVGFDIGGEEFREVPEPEYGYEDFVKTLCVYQGRLCLLCNCHGVCLDVWVLTDYGVKRSWEKLFKFEQPAVIPSFRFVIPLCVSKNSKVLVEKDGDAFVLYDPKCKEQEIFLFKAFQIGFAR
ncbi:hypothetical protein GIB67_002757 [Kingdonia uniflora]|uniref:F-box associated beta-propeller type 1 domain-containing protein n=1 Tax=Kingdonia uniflora TaxID=39325 RepID=A0A7J7MPW7_9MAGN|nr:hypothetical protein GIB67_002757 [Kingdonia uniflora]